jgi:signal transduction histidine kinase
VRFLVEDTGIGMRPEHLGEIFDVFHQVHDPSYAVQGTGLGLAIAKRLVRLMRAASKPAPMTSCQSLFATSACWSS